VVLPGFIVATVDEKFLSRLMGQKTLAIGVRQMLTINFTPGSLARNLIPTQQQADGLRKLNFMEGQSLPLPVVS